MHNKSTEVMRSQVSPVIRKTPPLAAQNLLTQARIQRTVLNELCELGDLYIRFCPNSGLCHVVAFESPWNIQI